VRENIEDGAGLRVLLRVEEAVPAEQAVMTVPAPHGWSGYRV